MHFIYQINRLTTTKVDSTYFVWLANNAQRICPVAGLERMTTWSAVSALPYRATQVDMFVVCSLHSGSCPGIFKRGTQNVVPFVLLFNIYEGPSFRNEWKYVIFNKNVGILPLTSRWRLGLPFKF